MSKYYRMIKLNNKGWEGRKLNSSQSAFTRESYKDRTLRAEGVLVSTAWEGRLTDPRSQCQMVRTPASSWNSPVTLERAPASGSVIPAYLIGGWCMLGITYLKEPCR